MSRSSTPALLTELGDQLCDPGLRSVYRSFLSNPQINFMMAAGAIVQAAKIIAQRGGAVLATVDLTMLRYEILARLEVAPDGRLPVRELSDALLLSSATMTYSLDHLEGRKLLRRHVDRNDRRAVIVEVTPAGARLAREATELLKTIHFGIEEDLDELTACEIAVHLSALRSNRA